MSNTLLCQSGWCGKYAHKLLLGVTAISCTNIVCWDKKKLNNNPEVAMLSVTGLFNALGMTRYMEVHEVIHKSQIFKEKLLVN